MVSAIFKHACGRKRFPARKFTAPIVRDGRCPIDSGIYFIAKLYAPIYGSLPYKKLKMTNEPRAQGTEHWGQITNRKHESREKGKWSVERGRGPIFPGNLKKKLKKMHIWSLTQNRCMWSWNSMFRKKLCSRLRHLCKVSILNIWGKTNTLAFALQAVPPHRTINSIAWLYRDGFAMKLASVTLHYITIVTLHHITSHHITLHYFTLHYVTLRYITLHYIT